VGSGEWGVGSGRLRFWAPNYLLRLEWGDVPCGTFCGLYLSVDPHLTHGLMFMVLFFHSSLCPPIP